MIPKHLDDCDNCPDQRIHHNDETGECMKRDCDCKGFVKKQ